MFPGISSTFHYCNKILEIINLKREKVYCGSQFWRLAASRPARWHIMVEVQGGGGLSSQQPGNKERKRMRSWSTRSCQPLNFLPPDPPLGTPPPSCSRLGTVPSPHGLWGTRPHAPVSGGADAAGPSTACESRPPGQQRSRGSRLSPEPDWGPHQMTQRWIMTVFNHHRRCFRQLFCCCDYKTQPE